MTAYSVVYNYKTDQDEVHLASCSHLRLSHIEHLYDEEAPDAATVQAIHARSGDSGADAFWSVLGPCVKRAEAQARKAAKEAQK